MEYHVVTDIDTHMAYTGGIIGSHKEYKVAGTGIGSRYRGTDIA